MTPLTDIMLKTRCKIKFPNCDMTDTHSKTALLTDKLLNTYCKIALLADKLLKTFIKMTILRSNMSKTLYRITILTDNMLKTHRGHDQAPYKAPFSPLWP